MPKAEARDLPVLGDVKAPLEREVSLLVVVNKAGQSVVVAAGKHATWGFLLVDYSLALVCEPNK